MVRAGTLVFQGLHFAVEVPCALEFLINGSESEVRHLIDLPQARQNLASDFVCRHLRPGSARRRLNALNDRIDIRPGDGTVRKRPFYPENHLPRVE